MLSSCLITVALVVAAALAQPQAAAVQQMIALNARALTAHEAGDRGEAVRLLLEAVAAGKQAGLASHKMTARTYFHLGVVHLDGGREEAVRWLVLALKLRADIKPGPTLESTALAEAMDEARKRLAEPPLVKEPALPVKEPPPPPREPPPPVKAPPAVAKESPPPPPPAPPPPSPPPPEPDLPAELPRSIHCPLPEVPVPDRPIVVRCALRPTVEAARVLLFHGADGQPFTQVPAVRSRKGWWTAEIPPRPGEVSFYVEARDRSDAVVATSGRRERPHRLGAGTRRAADGDPLEADEPAADPAPQVRARPARALASAGPDERHGRLFVGLQVGSGVGWHPTSKLELRRDIMVDAGARVSGLGHLAAEVGYHLTPAWSASLTLRYQYIPDRPDPRLLEHGEPSRGAISVLARGTRRVGDGSAVQLALSALLGAGEGFRLVVPARRDRNDPATDLPHYDTVRAGPIVGGAGAAVLYRLAARWAAVVELKLLVGPTGQALERGREPTVGVAYLADLGAGVQMTF